MDIVNKITPEEQAKRVTRENSELYHQARSILQLVKTFEKAKVDVDGNGIYSREELLRVNGVEAALTLPKEDKGYSREDLIKAIAKSLIERSVKLGTPIPDSVQLDILYERQEGLLEFYKKRRDERSLSDNEKKDLDTVILLNESMKRADSNNDNKLTLVEAVHYMELMSPVIPPLNSPNNLGK